MKLKTAKYFIKEGIANTWKHKLMCLASMGVVIASLIILGIFILISDNISLIATQIESNQRIQAYIKHEVGQEKYNEIKTKIEGFGLTSQVTLVTKEQALENFKKLKMFKGHESLLDGFDKQNNPLPASYILTVKKAEYSDRVVKLLKTIDEIGEVKYYKEFVDKIIRIMQIVRLVSLIVLVLLSATSVFIISNTIKLTVFARRKEIGIMKYVGATDWFIRWPFIIESIIIGALASLIAMLLMSNGYNVLISYFSSGSISKEIGVNSFISFDSVSNKMLITYIVIGIGIGCIGSMMSIRKYLRV